MIINLTQHIASPEQIAAGVVDLTGDTRQQLIDLLTVDSLPSRQEINARSHDIATLAALAFESHPAQAMIGGAPWMMSSLEAELLDRGIEPVYAFSIRVSEEKAQDDGTTVKVNAFNHAGFVPFK